MFAAEHFRKSNLFTRDKLLEEIRCLDVISEVMKKAPGSCTG
jgi:hypothetical protein